MKNIGNFYYQEDIHFKNRSELTNNINHMVKRRLGNGVFVPNQEIPTTKRADLLLGIYIPKIIDDSKTNKRVVKFLKFESVGILEIEKTKQGFTIVLPKADEFNKRLESKMSKLVFGVESTLLEATYKKLVEIPTIQTSLNPIREILVDVYKKGKFNLDGFIKYRGERKAPKYISFLESLELIKREGNNITAGNKFTLLEAPLKKDNEKLVYNYLLADVLRNGLEYIKEYLKLTTITPYIRLSNSYYLPSSQINDLLQLNQDAIMQNHQNIYGVKPLEKKAQNQISRLVDVDIFREEEDYIIGHKDILNNTIDTLGRFA